jgi:outer membrane lipoprotein-sorting protein
MKKIGLLSVFLGCFVVANGFGQEEAEEALRAKIMQTWKAREAKVKSAKWTWKQVHWEAKGSIVDVGTMEYEDPDNFYHKQIIPPRDITYDTDVEFYIENNSIRHHYTPQSWIPGGDGLKKTPETVVWTEKKYKYLYERTAGVDQPQGGIQDPKDRTTVLTPYLRPIFMTVRPTSKHFSVYQLDQLTVVSTIEKVRGRPCIRANITKDVHLGKYQFSVWYDLERDYCLVRETQSINGVITRQMDIDYAPHDIVGWIPTRWNWSRRSDPKGRIDTTFRAENVRAEFNTSLDPALFDIEFPMNTMVSDSVTNTIYKVKPDGNRVIYSRPSEQIASSQQWPSVLWWAGCLIGCAFLIYGGRWIYSRFQKVAD